MYQALYRKYRPKTLEEICGQKTIVRILKNTIKNDQINHAYLFTGPRGTGKTSIAKILAKIVNCENLENLEPCGKCANCTQTSNSDIIEIDAASNNGVDEIRELRNKVNLVPSYGKYKIYIIDEVHMLTVGAFNALLKTLEEPPAHVIFILATTDPQKIPETILSRCQRFDFKKITNEEIVENLERISKKEKIDIEKDALYEIVNGTITEKDLEDLEEAIIEQKLEKILEKTDLYNEKGKNFTKLIEEMINFIRNIILYKKIPKYLEKIHKNVENLEKISKKIEINELLRQIEILNKYSFEMKTTNNSKLMFELAMIQIVNIEENAILSKQEQNSAKEKEKENTIIKNDEVKEESKIIVPPKEKNEKLEKLKEIRINNTLSKFNKKETIRVKKEIEKSLHELLINQLYSKAAAMIIDGELKAASETNLIFVYDNSRISNLFEAINTKYNLIAVDKEEWEKIKEEFNNKKREFKYQEEQIKLEEILKDNEQDILKMFEDIIEYK